MRRTFEVTATFGWGINWAMKVRKDGKEGKEEGERSER
jgi:hypothetical protein